MTNITDDIAEEISFQGFEDEYKLLQSFLNDVLHREVGHNFMEKVERTHILAQMVLAIGTKLEMIVANMALKLQHQNTIVKGAPVVEPNDRLFWFNQPHFILTLLHFTLFMNVFEFAFFIWVTLQFGIKSCYHERAEIIVVRVVLAVTELHG